MPVGRVGGPLFIIPCKWERNSLPHRGDVEGAGRGTAD